MSTELAIVDEIKQENYPKIYGNNGLDYFYEKVKEQVSKEVPDLSTAKGRARIASLAAAVSKSKTAVEKPGREYLKQLKDMPKKIEAELREYADKMDKLRDEIRQPLTDWENAEARRVAQHKENIAALAAYRTANIATSHNIGELIESLEAVTVDQSFEEFEAQAHREKAASISFLRDELVKAEKREAEQAELERLRAEAVAREQKEREERIAREAAEKAKREAEESARREREAAERRELELKTAAENAERQRIAAEQAAKAAEEARVKAEQEAKARAEQAAKAAEERVKQEAEAKAKAEAAEQARREADKAHRAEINRAAKAAFVENGFDDEQATLIVVLIAQNKIPNTKINY